jgi:N-methylhydantoinase A/oxoprolinase/acetone carboxylase beta subunit
MLLGVDVGGTFTDAVLAVDGRLITAKAPTTPEDQSEGVLAAVRSSPPRASPTSSPSGARTGPSSTACARAVRSRSPDPTRASARPSG